MSRVRDLAHDHLTLHRSVESSRLLTGRGLAMQVQGRGVLPSLRNAEFRVFSQYGDDGIIQYLVGLLGPMEERFIEFGVEDYTESNTRFLLMNSHWTGLVLDGDQNNVARIVRADWYWRYNVTAACAFLSAENINGIFVKHGFDGPIGLLSVDVDGIDYWLWDAIQCVEPVIVVAEYNAVFGAKSAVTVPYDPSFQRRAAHASCLYWGASLKALCQLAERKGFSFVGTNGAGNNAYFVKNDRLGPLQVLSCEEGFVDSCFRESRDRNGRLSFLTGSARRKAIAEMQVTDVASGKTVKVGELE